MPLPSKEDFVPTGCDLDELHAWKKFGGLSLSEAEAKFRTNPLFYQEDFMFMGHAAFAYYFPVLENYIFETPVETLRDDGAMGIIASGILLQFEGKIRLHLLKGKVPDDSLQRRAKKLAEHVLKQVENYIEEGRRSDALIQEWNRLKWTRLKNLEHSKSA